MVDIRLFLFCDSLINNVGIDNRDDNHYGYNWQHHYLRFLDDKKRYYPEKSSPKPELSRHFMCSDPNLIVVECPWDFYPYKIIGANCAHVVANQRKKEEN